MIGVIDYGAGNQRNVVLALRRLGVQNRIIEKPDEFRGVKGVIFPGVGAARSAMERLEATGLSEALRMYRGPFLGICLGMQLLVEFSEEQDIPCLGILHGRTSRFPPRDKIPHMGWNAVSIRHPSALFRGVEDGSYCYFVHSYFVQPAEQSAVLAVTNYIVEFASAVEVGNLMGVQFHPEKSGDVGLTILRNFYELCL
ncbi:MAG: imidazole glycerol phosphate synthase subunit HisH [Deltaproteobacteria bacterium]|nr:imidazole glycerol phosphate synthase subunit HisH [Deltaproteobacteria bacterium]MBW2305537.1 imidazole glycerol phosphate synthase subunit HisH [Deltaproteobacteria bacterium]